MYVLLQRNDHRLCGYAICVIILSNCVCSLIRFNAWDVPSIHNVRMTSASTSVSSAGPQSTQTTASGYPRSQNPVVTLLQKRRGLWHNFISVCSVSDDKCACHASIVFIDWVKVLRPTRHNMGLFSHFGDALPSQFLDWYWDIIIFSKTGRHEYEFLFMCTRPICRSYTIHKRKYFVVILPCVDYGEYCTLDSFVDFSNIQVYILFGCYGRPMLYFCPVVSFSSLI